VAPHQSRAVARATCAYYASPSGTSRGTGSQESPFPSIRRLLRRLEPGQTGCLQSGVFNENVAVRHGGLIGRRLVLRAAPGATVKVVGRLVVHAEASDVTISGLALDGTNATDGPSPTIDGTRIHLRGNDITSPRAVCVFIGSTLGWGVAVDTVLTGNRIHGCGTRPPTNKEHGIYIQSARGTVIEKNMIYNNADRGIQLYPDAKRTIIRRNVIWGNGEGLIFSGDGGRATSGTRVSRNIIGASRIRYNIESYWPDVVGTDNLVGANCLWNGARGNIGPTTGFTLAAPQVVADPGFVDPAAGNFSRSARGACAGFGPTG
jgi:parallel beta-helix repeat protein